jgi:hypothetical protein
VPQVRFDIRCNQTPYDQRNFEIEVTKGTKLIDLFKSLAKSEVYVSKYLFNLNEECLYPHHIIFIDGELLIPKDMPKYIIENKTIHVRIMPFLFGG